MSTQTQNGIESIVDELHRSAARNIALKNQSEMDFPWRQHDARIYRERAEADLAAARHLMEVLSA